MKIKYLQKSLVLESLGVLIVTCCWLQSGLTQAQTGGHPRETALPLVFETDFNDVGEMAHWEFSDDGWKLNTIGAITTLSQFRKQGKLKTKVRSPFHRAILKTHDLTDFQLDVRVLSTHPSYHHRDVCVFFGYQSPSKFYYVHLGEKTDPHCNQIFIVNDKDREKITRTTNDGTKWDDDFHDLRIVRNSKSGLIEVYFDDLNQPVMTAIDKTFTTGRVGLGSFDDTAEWSQFRLYGFQGAQSAQAGSDNKP